MRQLMERDSALAQKVVMNCLPSGKARTRENDDTGDDIWQV